MGSFFEKNVLDKFCKRMDRQHISRYLRWCDCTPVFLGILGVCLAVLLGGCATDPASWNQKQVLEQIAPTPGVGNFASLGPALEGSLRYVRSKAKKEGATAFAASDPESPVRSVTWGQMETTLLHLQELLPHLDARPELLQQEFVWMKIGASTLLTGYYEPFLEASLTPRPDYPYPLYALPPEAKQGAPLPARAEIDGKGALAGRGLEIAWAKNAVDVFFLQVQGSGRLLLPDGSQVRARYAGGNGYQYVSLGKKFIEMGLSSRDEMSMQKIREILEGSPEKMQELMFLNPKYIFFAIDDDGPFGATGAKLTPMLSCASDPSWAPMGSVIMAAAALPEDAADQSQVPENLVGLLLAQDTGTMQRAHLDLYCGSGPRAAALAGRMSGRAAAWVLVSRRALDN